MFYKILNLQKTPNNVDRVGMLMIENDGTKIDLDSFMKSMKDNVANYAIPIFVRITPTITSIRTVDRIRFADEGFDPRKLKKDQLFYWNKKTDKYEDLTKEIYADIVIDKILL